MQDNHELQRTTFNPEEIFVINTERRPLPFKSYGKIKTKQVSTWKEFETVIKDACGRNENMSQKAKEYFQPVKLIFIDSFTRILYLISKHLRATGATGYTFYKEYGELLESLLMENKPKDKILVCTAIDEVIQDDSSVYRSVVSAEGRMRGRVESYFDVVLWTRFDKMKKKPECYQFETNYYDGKTSSKSPDGMLENVIMQNDLSMVIYAMRQFYDLDNNTGIEIPTILIAGKSGSGKSTSLKNCIMES